MEKEGKVFDEISQRISNWRRFGRLVGVEEHIIINIDKNYHNKEEKLYRCILHKKESTKTQIGWPFWRQTLLKLREGTEVVDILEKEYSSYTYLTDSENEHENDRGVKYLFIDIFDIISQRVSNWKQFAQVLNIEYIFKEIEENDQYKNNPEEKIYRCIKEKQNNQQWYYWRGILLKMDEKDLVEDIEILYPRLLDDERIDISDVDHQIINSNQVIYAHHADRGDNFRHLPVTLKDTIKVCVGAGSVKEFCPIYSFHDDYFEKYNILLNIKKYDFANTIKNEECEILKIQNEWLQENNDSGFSIKGYDANEHLQMFSADYTNNNPQKELILTYSEKYNAIIYINTAKESNNIKKLMRDNCFNIRSLLTSNQCLNGKSFTYIPVTLLAKDVHTDKDMCKTCVQSGLVVSSDQFKSLKLFKEWWETLWNGLHKQQPIVENNDISINFLKSIIGFMSLATFELPSYTKDPELEIKEVQNLILLTPEQQNIIYSIKKRKIIKGSFGTGKTVAAQQLLKVVLDNLSIFEFVYYLFHSSSSAYVKEMKKVATESKNNNVMACNVADLVKDGNKLSSIFQTLLDIHEYDKKTHTVNVFIEEFNGEVLDQEEVEKLSDILSKRIFKNAHIVLVCQSMESDRYLIQDKNRMFYNIYQFEKLVDLINFEIFDLSYLLRSSQHINNMVDAAIPILNKAMMKSVVPKVEPSVKFTDISNTSNIEEYLVIELSRRNSVTIEKYIPPQKNNSVPKIEETANKSVVFKSEQISSSSSKSTMLSNGSNAEEGLDSIIPNIHNLITKLNENHQANNSKKEQQDIYTSSSKENITKTLPSLNFKAKQRQSLENQGKHNPKKPVTRQLSVNISDTDKLLKYFAHNSSEYGKKIEHQSSFNFIGKRDAGHAVKGRKTIIYYPFVRDKRYYISKITEIFKKWYKPERQDYSRQIYCLSKVLTKISCSNKNIEQIIICMNDDSKRMVETALTVNNAKWTDDPELLLTNKFQILLTDYASVRGCEFLSVTIICPIDEHHLKQNIIGGMSRCMKDLSLVVLRNKGIPDETIIKILDTWKHNGLVEIDNENYLKSSAPSELEEFLKINKDLLIKDDVKQIVKINDGEIYQKFFNKRQLDKGKDVLGTIETAASEDTSLYIWNICQKAWINDDAQSVVDVLKSKNLNINSAFKFKLEENNVGVGSLLHYAVYKSDKEIVKFLLKANIDVNIVDNENITPLYFAVKKKHTDIIKILLQQEKVNVNAFDTSGETALHEAVDQNEIDTVKVLLQNKNIDINVANKMGYTPLHRACNESYIDIVTLLLKNDEVKVNISNKYGNTPLHDASSQNNTGIVEVLLKDDKVNVNTPDAYGQTALHCAINNRNTNIVKLLLQEHKVEVNIREDNGSTPFHNALYLNNIDIVKLMLQVNRVDVNTPCGLFFMSPLHLAVYKNHTDVIILLLKEDRIDSNRNDGLFDGTVLHRAVNENSSDMVALLLKEGSVDVNTRDKKGETALHKAVDNNYINIVKLLLNEDEVDVNLGNKFGKTPLHVNIRNNHIDLMKVFLKEDKLDVNLTDPNGFTPFYDAVDENRIDIVQLMLKEDKVDVNLADTDGTTPFSLAVSKKYIDIVQLLLKEDKVDVNLVDNEGNTPLSIAVWQSRIDIVQLLLKEEKMDVNLADNEGNTPFGIAVIRNNIDIVQLMLKEDKVDVNLADNEGITPFNRAVINKNIYVIQMLLKEDKVDVNKTTQSGTTPFCSAVINYYVDVVQLLLKEDKVDVNVADNEGSTPFHKAVSENRIDIVKLLLQEEKVDINTINNKGETPLDIASNKKINEIIMLLK